jgi:hypothetical protein
MDTVAANGKKAGLLSLAIILLLAIILWVVLRGPGTDADGLKSAYLLETGQALRSLSDHLLWQELGWLTYTMGLQIDTGMRGIPAQQIVNLLLFSLAIVVLWSYLQRLGKPFWLVGLGLLASYTSLRCLTGEDVDVGPLLLTSLLLFILPGTNIRSKLLWTVLILSLAPVMHKSLTLLIAGWWLAEVFRGEGTPIKRVSRATLISAISVCIAFIFYYASWYLLSGESEFWRWFFPHGQSTGEFFSLNPLVIGKGFALAGYRTFLSITPLKALARGDILGYLGITLSAFSIILLVYLIARAIWRGKSESAMPREQQSVVNTMLLALLPSFIFFLFWIPGYYTYWARFLPVFWIILALRLPERIATIWAKRLAIGALMLVNMPSQFVAKDGEEAGVISRWIAPKLTPGDLLILPGNGVLYFGSMPQYHYHVNIATLDVIEVQNDPVGYIGTIGRDTFERGNRVWLVSDYARWTSESVLQGEQRRFERGVAAVEQTFTLGAKENLADPNFKEAWVAECLPRK